MPTAAGMAAGCRLQVRMARQLCATPALLSTSRLVLRLAPTLWCAAAVTATARNKMLVLLPLLSLPPQMSRAPLMAGHWRLWPSTATAPTLGLAECCATSSLAMTSAQQMAQCGGHGGWCSYRTPS